MRRSGAETMDQLIKRAQKLTKDFNSNTPEIQKLVKSFFDAPDCKYIIDHYNNINSDIELLKAAGEW